LTGTDNILESKQNDMNSQNIAEPSTKKSSGKSVVVIGGGLSGLASCLELCKQGYKTFMLEKQNFAGGLATSIPYEGYNLDIGPHFMALPKESEITDEILDLMGSEKTIKLPDDIFSKFYKTNFNGRLYSGYPSLIEVIFKTTRRFLVLSLWDFFIAKCKNIITKGKHDNAEKYLISTYGKFLYKIWFKPYLYRKYPGIEPPLDQVMKKFPPLTFTKILRSTKKSEKKLEKHDDEKEEDNLICYFKGGMGTLINTVQEEILKHGGEINLGVDIKSIEHKGDTKTIIFSKNDKQEKINADKIVYCLPLNIAIQWFEGGAKRVMQSPKKTNSYNTIILFLLIDTPKLYDSWVVNFYDTDLSFFRIAQQNFLTETVAPKGKSLLSVEIKSSEQDPLWKMNDNSLFSRVKSDLEKIKILNGEKIDGFKILKFKNLARNYELNKDFSSKPLNEFINSFENEYPVGTESDSGLLAGSTEQSPQTITYGAGMYMAFVKAKNLIRNIELPKGK
jgi:protoporphyrinogen oxidase